MPEIPDTLCFCDFPSINEGAESVLRTNFDQKERPKSQILVIKNLVGAGGDCDVITQPADGGPEQGGPGQLSEAREATRYDHEEQGILTFCCATPRILTSEDRLPLRSGPRPTISTFYVFAASHLAGRRLRQFCGIFLQDLRYGVLGRSASQLLIADSRAGHFVSVPE